VHCTRSATDPACKQPPKQTLPGGAWIVDTDPSARTVTLAHDATGSLYPAGVTFWMAPDKLADQPVRDGYVANWPTIQVPAFLTFRHGELVKVKGYLLSE